MVLSKGHLSGIEKFYAGQSQQSMRMPREFYSFNFLQTAGGSLPIFLELFWDIIYFSKKMAEP